MIKSHFIPEPVLFAEAKSNARNNRNGIAKAFKRDDFLSYITYREPISIFIKLGFIFLLKLTPSSRAKCERSEYFVQWS